MGQTELPSVFWEVESEVKCAAKVPGSVRLGMEAEPAAVVRLGVAAKLNVNLD